MAQFESFDDNVEVNDTSVLGFVNAIDFGKDLRESILLEHGVDVGETEWHDQQAYLDALREIHEKVGEKTMYMIGKAILENAVLAPNVDGLKSGLESLDVGYKMNHRGGDLGHIKLVEFDDSANQARMECKNPYPSEFDRGLITTMLHRMTPNPTYKAQVKLDVTEPNRKAGADQCYYDLTW